MTAESYVCCAIQSLEDAPLRKIQALLPLSAIALVAIGTLEGVVAQTPQHVQVRIERWLEVSQRSGNVTVQRGASRQSAQIGTRLQQPGDTLQTGDRSSATLTLDTQAGSVSLSPNTVLRIQQLESSPQGGFITRLQIPSGQARLQVNPFSTPDSRLEIETPAGSSAVRGTEFGVSVQPNGTTAVATLEGEVITSAQGEAVSLPAGYQTLIVPGEPPTSPTPFENEVLLWLTILSMVDEDTVRISARVDPVNLVRIQNIPQTLTRDGEFDILVPLPPNRRVEALIITPSGRQQLYQLAVPPRD